MDPTNTIKEILGLLHLAHSYIKHRCHNGGYVYDLTVSQHKEASEMAGLHIYIATEIAPV